MRLQKIRRVIRRHVPEPIKDAVRTAKKVFFPRRNPEIPYEELMIFDRLKDRFHVVFDIGAREDLSFYRMKPDCHYYLFEPNQKAIAILKNQIASLPDAHIILNEYGLADQAADNCIYYEDSQSFAINPFHKDTDTGQRYSLRTLDWYVQQHDINHIDFLKIDAEGFDYKIIKGGLETINTKVDFVQFEYWDGVQKFIDLIGTTFNFYLMIEPRLLDAINTDVVDIMTSEQKAKDYNCSVIPLDHACIDLIDRLLAPVGYGGNILAVKKTISGDIIETITFPIR